MKALPIAAILCLVAAGGIGVWRLGEALRVPPAIPPASPMPAATATPTPTPDAAGARIAAEQAAQDQTLWRTEVEAQRYEQPFIDLWDGMRRRIDDQHVLLAAFPFTHLHLRPFGHAVSHAWDVRRAVSSGELRTLDHAAWEALVREAVAQGERIEHCEWHHQQFERLPDGHARSRIGMKLFLANDRLARHTVVSGSLTVRWSDHMDAHGQPQAEDIDASDLTATWRQGPLPFQEASTFSPGVIGRDVHASLDPVLGVDLDGDGRTDLVLPSLDLWLRNTSAAGSISFEPRPLFAQPLSLDSMHVGPYITAAVAADFTGHGLLDLMVCGQDLPPCLYVMSPQRTYDRAPVPLMHVPPETFQYPVTMTAGDVNGDGLPDVWIGQYRRPYINGNIPKPYYDADDGYPSFLLLNHGECRFEDATERAGLTTHRDRRTWSSALLDLDGDGHLDLVTVNDFAGIDLYRNDGHGHFHEATDHLADQRTMFGMSLAVADFLNRGLLDLFVTGMGSTTARRLEQMHLGRQDMPEYNRMRPAMGYGNRLLLQQPDHTYRQAPFNDTIARTGWSWGCAALDVANDGWMDVYVADGNLSRTTAKDYCSRFWTHDIYLGSDDSPALESYFHHQPAGLEGMSWNPYEHKALLMNEGNGHFLDVAYLMGLGFEYDGREVLAIDLDGDGRTDIVEVELQPGESTYGLTRPVLHVYRNTLATTHHWIQVRLKEAPHHPRMGAVIDLIAGTRHSRAVIVSGDGFRTQQPPLAHFGLGDLTAVDEIHVRWSDGTERTIHAPPIDRELVVDPVEVARAGHASPRGSQR